MGEGGKGVNGIALSAVGIGVLLIWSGIKGWALLGTAGDIIVGKAVNQPNSNPLSNPLAEPSSNTGAALGVGELGVPTNNLAAVAVQYQGHAYLYGGAPGRDGSKPWDCSSFCNWVASVKLGLPIPGYGPGKYDGTVHGPPTGGWGTWTGLRSVSRADVAAGDLIIWLNHMGIAINNSQMISALNPSQGTKITTIDGNGNGPLLKYGRY